MTKIKKDNLKARSKPVLVLRSYHAHRH